MKKLILIILFTGFGLNQGKSQCACCGSTSGFSGGESSPGVYALAKNKWLSEMYADFRSFNGISAPHPFNDKGMSNVSALAVDNMGIGIIGLRYGISNKTTLLIQQPVFWINSPSVNSKTFGDLLSLINYIPLSKPGIIITLQGGMEWPTGQKVEISNGSSISTGSGSFDPVAGLNVLKPFKRSFIRAAAFFKYTTKGFDNTFFGNFFGQQLNYTLLLSDKLNSCSPDSLKEDKLRLSLNFQLAGELSQKQLREHIFLENTGSFVVLGSAGATAAFKGFSIPIMFSVPLHQNLRGEQNLTQFRLRLGLTKTF